MSFATEVRPPVRERRTADRPGHSFVGSLLDIELAPRDGTVIEICHGAKLELVSGRWRGGAGAFVPDRDPYSDPISRIIGWRPITRGESGRPFDQTSRQLFGGTHPAETTSAGGVANVRVSSGPSAALRFLSNRCDSADAALGQVRLDC
jgi:hypothetical protein